LELLVFICEMKKRKNITDQEETRFGLFMDENSFNLEIMYGRDYLNTDINQTVKIHRINLLETKSHSLYGQSKPSDKSFMAPVSINIMPNVETTEQKYYGDVEGGISRDDSGNISFGVYLKELEEKQLEINRGDIIEYNMSGTKNRYYEVESANNVTDITNQTIAGFRPYWRKVTGVPVRSDVITFFDGGEKGV
jgi:hypothetical protein